MAQETALRAYEAEAPPAPGGAPGRALLRADALAGMAVLLAACLVALLAPWISPHDPIGQNLRSVLRPPFFLEGALPGYLLGTDGLGRDLLSYIFHGFRISMAVGLASVAISAVLGVTLGVWAGYRGGRVDALVMRLADFQLTLPTVLVALAVIALFGSGVGKLILLIGLTHWAVYGRTVRGSVLAIREREFVESARALGASPWTVIRCHVLPNVMTPILIIAAVELPRVMLLESTLSFLGLGVPPTVPSLGGAIAHGYGYLLSGYWWLTVLPGLALMVVVVAINLLGDWLRDVLDPRVVR
ncbi:MAG: ABC transporter permease [Candidatus Tectomicrobia bacterium]|uniref:ABC transporter permease n=1 Tax=Tectimicrobiota bacterium TaxID=2528274 RepID=A0A932HX11_UNCTE|nr:ABC transporter permease [Candidatus Tectomicrobia bacterium]